MPPTLTPYSPFLTAKHPGGSEILDRNLLAIKKAIGDADAVINRITRIVNIDAGGAGVNDAQFWLSTANPLLPNGVDMGALGTGVLQQTVTLGVATPVAVSLVPTDVVFGSAAGLIEQDHRFVYDTATGSLWLRQFASGVQTVTIATAFSSNETSLLIRSDTTAGALTLETGTAATSQGPAFQLRGNFYPSFHDWVSVQRAIGVSFSYDGSGGVDQNNGVFKVNLKSFYEFSGNSSALAGAAYLDSFSWRGVTHRIIGSNSTNADGVNFHAFYPGTLLSAPNWSAENSATVAIYGPTVFTPVDGSSGAIGDVYALRITGAGHIDRTDGTWEWRTGSTSPVSPAGSGRIRYNESLNQMEFSQNGSAYAPFGTGGGTVTSVGGTSPIVSSGGTTPVISILDFVASGASHARGAVPDPGAVAGTAKFLREDATWAVPPSSGGTVTAVTASSPLASSGGTTPNITHNTTAVTPGSYTFTSLTVDAYGHVTGIAANTWPTSGQVVVSNGSGPVGDVLFTYDTGTDLLTLGVGATQAWYNVAGTDYERVRAFWSVNRFFLKNEVGGAGGLCDMAIQAPGGQLELLGSDGSGVQLLAGTSASVSISSGGLGLNYTAAPASGTSAVLDAIKLTVIATVSGGTNITTAGGYNGVVIPQAIINGAFTVTTAATLKINSSPGGTATITNPYALWSADGLNRFGGTVMQAKGSNVASGSTIAIPTDGNTFNVSGTTTINGATFSYTAIAGQELRLVFLATVTVKHMGGFGVNFDLSGDVDFNAVAGDVLNLYYDGTNLKEVGRSLN